MGAAIVRHARAPLSNRIGADTLPQLLALLARATVLLSPDSGPVHMATMVGHAGHRPVCGHQSRPAAGPTCPATGAWTPIPRRPQRFRGRSVEQLPWTTKIEVPGGHGPDRGAAGHRETRRLARIAAMTDLHVPVSARRAARQDHHPAHQEPAHPGCGQARQCPAGAGAAGADLGDAGRRPRGGGRR